MLRRKPRKKRLLRRRKQEADAKAVEEKAAKEAEAEAKAAEEKAAKEAEAKAKKEAEEKVKEESSKRLKLRLLLPLLRRQKRSLLLRKKSRSRKNFNVSNNVLNLLISRS